VAGSADAPVSEAQEMAAAIIARADHAYAMPGEEECDMGMTAASALATMVEQLHVLHARSYLGHIGISEPQGIDSQDHI